MTHAYAVIDDGQQGYKRPFNIKCQQKPLVFGF